MRSISARPNQTGVGPKDGNAAANRRQRTALIPGLSIAPGATFWIRFSDFNVTPGADDGLAVDDWSIIANFSGALLSIDDVSAFEGNGGTTLFSFTVSLSQPAPLGGVTFDLATVDGSATIADNDYVTTSLPGESIAQGQTDKQYSFSVNGDVDIESTEAFTVTVSNLSNAFALDPQGTGTIVDDDTPITLIHDIQGNGISSPIAGNSATIRGIVTGVKSNGFFVQEEDIDTDADPNTSEGIFVFTSSAPPAAAAFTAQVQVTGTVAEFVPSGDPQQPPSTQLTSPTTVQTLPPGQPLPTAATLTPTLPDPAGPFDQLERVRAHARQRGVDHRRRAERGQRQPDRRNRHQQRPLPRRRHRRRAALPRGGHSGAGPAAAGRLDPADSALGLSIPSGCASTARRSTASRCSP